MSIQDMERLRYFVEKRIQTTMIGALARFEDNLGFLWGVDKDENTPLTPEEERYADIWDFTRNQILNQGNAQIRYLKEDFDKHGPSCQRTYRYTFGKPRGEDKK
jgi:hypothetical protein